jgi:lipopolysaccharide transport system ATP-binding protein
MSCDQSNAVEVVNVGKSFAVRRGPSRLVSRLRGRPVDVDVLRGVDFSVRKGESVGIVGVNGSGKSTLLQIIAGTMSPTTGSVKIRGRVGAILELGAGFHPEFSGRENAKLGLALMGLSDGEIAAALGTVKAFSDLGDYFELPVKTYSSGMYVRLAFSVAISCDPDILIVDEALAVGDAAFQRKCYERLARVKEKGGTLLFVSHDEEAVRTLTDRAVLLHKGDMVDFGPSDAIAFRHRQMTLSSGSVAHEGGKLFGDGSIRSLDATLVDAAGGRRDIFSDGERVTVRVSFVPDRDLSSSNVNIRLRSPTGVKVYSGGTLNDDMARPDPALGFWGLTHKAGIPVTVDFSFDCVLGQGKYEVQALVSHEGTPNYLDQTILAWKDDAAVLEVVRSPSRFGGLVNLRPEVSFSQGGVL